MSANGSLLAQVALGTSAAQVFQASLRTEITRIVIANTTGGALTFDLYHDDAGGATYTAATALYMGKNVPANDSVVIEAQSAGSGIQIAPDGELAAKGSTAGLTASIYGITQEVFKR